MITKKVNRYWCEFCRKAGQSAGHIKRHEESCTLNPNRVCRVCRMTWGDPETRIQKPIAELKSVLPVHSRGYYESCIIGNPGPPPSEIGIPVEAEVEAEINTSLIKLRELTQCPACIMAALRQAGIPVPMATGFNFTEEMKTIWTEINENQRYSDAAAMCWG